jgi:hypothetical protein
MARVTPPCASRDYGAKVVPASQAASPEDYLRTAAANSTHSRQSASSDWILCLDPRESLTEKLAASLFEWKSESFHTHIDDAPVFSVFVREETAQGWMQVPTAQTRLVPRSWNLWNGWFPVHDASALALEGELLRFAFP